MAANFKTQPPQTTICRLTVPAPFVLLVTLTRPKALNCIGTAGHHELSAVWAWFDHEPSLRVGVITGEGRAFCAGQDLKEWNTRAAVDSPRSLAPGGFAGISTRGGRKPIVAAVNGLALGGGCELMVNCDMVVAHPAAEIGLPEVKRGVAALAGALPRIVRTVGKQRAMELALTGRSLSAHEAKDWGLVNHVAEDVVGEAVKWAQTIAANSPDSIIVSREGIKMGWEKMSAQEATARLARDWFTRLEDGENIKEGLKAFVEKRKPNWVDSKL